MVADDEGVAPIMLGQDIAQLLLGVPTSIVEGRPLDGGAVGLKAWIPDIRLSRALGERVLVAVETFENPARLESSRVSFLANWLEQRNDAFPSFWETNRLPRSNRISPAFGCATRTRIGQPAKQ
jgi:hypothetical protein